MRLALRPYVTTGVALVGASVIAVTPITPTPAPVQAQSYSVQLSASVQNSDAPSPFAALLPPPPSLATADWLAILTRAVDNTTHLAQDGAESILGVLGQQALANVMGYGEMFVTSLTGGLTGLNRFMTDLLPQQLQTAFDQFSAGQISQGVMTLDLLRLQFLTAVGFPFFPLLDIPRTLAQDFADVVNVAMNVPINLVTRIDGMLGGASKMFADDLQAFVEAVNAGDPMRALGVVVNAPAHFIGTLLNGYRPWPDRFPNLWTSGLLNNQGPLYWALVTFPRLLAAAITPAATPRLLAAEVSAETAPESSVAELPQADSLSIESGVAADATEGTPDTDPASAVNEVATDEVTEAPEAETPAAEVAEGTDETDGTGDTEDLGDASETSEGTEDSEETGEDATGPEDSDGSESPDDATDLSGGDTEESDDTRPGNTTGNGSGLNAGADDDDSDSPAAGNSRAGSGNDSSGNDAGGSNGDSDSGSDS